MVERRTSGRTEAGMKNGRRFTAPPAFLHLTKRRRQGRHFFTDRTAAAVLTAMTARDLNM